MITGCNSGIGYAIAQIALKEGHNVHALDIVEGEKLKSLEGPKCKIGQLDVTSLESIQRFAKSLGDEPVDILLNVAGQNSCAPKQDPY